MSCSARDGRTSTATKAYGRSRQRLISRGGAGGEAVRRGLGRAPWVFPTSEGNRPHRDAVKPTLNMLRGRRPNGTTARHKLAKKREAVIPRDANLHDMRRTVADRMLNALSVTAYVVDVGVLGRFGRERWRIVREPRVPSPGGPVATGPAWAEYGPISFATPCAPFPV